MLLKYLELMLATILGEPRDNEVITRCESLWNMKLQLQNDTW